MNEINVRIALILRSYLSLAKSSYTILCAGGGDVLVMPRTFLDCVSLCAVAENIVRVDDLWSISINPTSSAEYSFDSRIGRGGGCKGASSGRVRSDAMEASW